MPGSVPDSIGDTGLFLTLGDAFSVAAYALVETLENGEVIQIHDQIISQSQLKLRNMITRRNPYVCDCEVSNVMIDQVAFKQMSLVFTHKGQVQKQQEVFSGVIGNYLLHITVICYNVLAGAELIEAILGSSFEP